MRKLLVLSDSLYRFQKRLGYQFQSEGLLQQALTHKSAHHLHNERLEFLGDSILNFIVAQALFDRFPAANEGELTRARASLVNKPTLAEIARELDFGDALKLGMGERKSGGFRRESILADTLEAVLAAIYLDASIEQAKQCVHDWFKSRLQDVVLSDQKDPKTRLQEWLQSQQRALPKYEVQSIAGEPHSQHFIVVCLVDGFSPVEGQGDSRRFAEQSAASKLLEMIDDK
jgi:ribonuclease-3